ncbi:protein-tyrosine phosphatase family protein [Steroidobacter flavus]|uniref:Protein-tyrosine phosphatase family protein n=1 Tax=Steroidobacter flavus TaxID=1842136 RepID=A0ABV8SWT1_9GAMM
MLPEIYWISDVTQGRLGIMARPRAGDWLQDEILGWRSAGVDAVVCLLEASEIHELGLVDEHQLCTANAIQFSSLPTPDRGVPASMAPAMQLVDHIVGLLRSGSSVAIHCRAGIGRSSLIAACAMLRLGFDADSIFPSIGRCRGVSVPDTPAQVEWLETFAETTHGT